jgi:MFS family permease
MDKDATGTGDDRVRRSLKYSILDGAFSASMIGFGESFFVAFAVFLRATNIHIGLLSSLPQALGSLLQFFSDSLIRLFGSRKRLVACAALLQALMYIPIALEFFFGEFRVLHLIVFASIYWIFGMILSPAWNSWMGDLTDERRRGGYFGKRNKITGFSSFVSFLIAGYILERFSGSAATEYAGFAAIFAIAFSARVASFVFLTKKYEPPHEFRPEAGFSFVDFIRQARFRNYGLFTLYLSLMNFSIYLVAPFFTPYMLNDLKLDYMTFSIINAAAIIAKLLSTPIWGRASDQFGARKVLSLTGFLMPVIPLLWAFSGDVAYLVLIQVYSGFIWGGFEISSFSFIFDTTSPQKRATCVAYYNVLNGMALFSGAMAGSLIARYNNVFWSKYVLLFIVSTLLRYAVSFALLPRLREVRIVEAIPYHALFFKVISTMPTMGLVHNLIPFRKIRKNGPEED